MNSVEVRTREALHRVAGGLVVSDQDMDRIEEDVMTLVEKRSAPPEVVRGPRLRRDWAVAAIAVIGLVLAGLALWRAEHPTTPPATPPSTRTSTLVSPELIGLWHNVGGGWIWEFSSDGRFGYVDTSSAYLRGEAQQITTSDRNGDVYTVSEVESGSTCVTEFWIRLTGRDKAVLTTMRSQCHAENVGSDVELERVSPRGASSAPLEPALERERVRSVTSVLDLLGTWVEPATGTVLAVGGQRQGDERAEYSVDDDGDGSVSADQTGVITLAPRGSTSADPVRTTSGACAPVFTRVRTDTATLTTTSGNDGCFAAGSTQTWLKLTE